jgi:hypothetical protein
VFIEGQASGDGKPQQRGDRIVRLAGQNTRCRKKKFSLPPNGHFNAPAAARSPRQAACREGCNRRFAAYRLLGIFSQPGKIETGNFSGTR